MVAINQLISALPLILAASSTVSAQFIDHNDLVVRSDTYDVGAYDTLQARDDDFDLWERDIDDDSLAVNPTRRHYAMGKTAGSRRPSRRSVAAAGAAAAYRRAAYYEELYARGGKGSKEAKPEKKKIDKSQIKKGGFIGSTNPAAHTDRRPSSQYGDIPIKLDLGNKGKKSKREALYARGGKGSKEAKPEKKKIDKSQIKKGGFIGSSNPAAHTDPRPSSQYGDIPIKLDLGNKGKKSKRDELHARGGKGSKEAKPEKKKIDKSQIKKGGFIGSSNPAAHTDPRPSSQYGDIPIKLDLGKKGKKN